MASNFENHKVIKNRVGRNSISSTLIKLKQTMLVKEIYWKIYVVWVFVYLLYKTILLISHKNIRQHFVYLLPKLIPQIISFALISFAIWLLIKKEVKYKYHYIISFFIVCSVYTTYLVFYLPTNTIYSEDRSEWLLLSERAKGNAKEYIINYQKEIDLNYEYIRLTKESTIPLHACKQYLFFNKTIYLYCRSINESIADRVLQHPFLYPLILSYFSILLRSDLFLSEEILTIITLYLILLFIGKIIDTYSLNIKSKWKIYHLILTSPMFLYFLFLKYSTRIDYLPILFSLVIVWTIIKYSKKFRSLPKYIFFSGINSLIIVVILIKYSAIFLYLWLVGIIFLEHLEDNKNLTISFLITLTYIVQTILVFAGVYIFVHYAIYKDLIYVTKVIDIKYPLSLSNKIIIRIKSIFKIILWPIYPLLLALSTDIKKIKNIKLIFSLFILIISMVVVYIVPERSVAYTLAILLYVFHLLFLSNTKTKIKIRKAEYFLVLTLYLMMFLATHIFLKIL